MKLEKTRRKKDGKIPAIALERKSQASDSVLKTKHGEIKPYDFGYEDK